MASQKSQSVAMSMMGKTATAAPSIADKSGTVKLEEEAAYNSVSLAPSRKDISSRSVMDKSVAFNATVMAGPSIIQGASTRQMSVRKSMVGGPRSGRRLILMRNAERVDRIFPEWMTVAFISGNKYRPYDMNLPLKLPPRNGFPEVYRYDGPITELGAMTAQMIGRGFTANKTNVGVVVSSPAMRCVQTANNVIKAMDNKLRFAVEPSLFDFAGWYDQLPIWMDDTEMAGQGFAVDTGYQPIESRDACQQHKAENYVDFQKRCATNATNLLDRYKDRNTIVIVTHGTTIDAIVRGLIGKSPTDLTAEQMNALGTMFPFCSLVVLDEQTGGKWKVMEDAMPYVTYLDFSNCPSIPYV